MLRRVIGSVGILLVSCLPAAAANITIGGLTVNDQGQFTTVPGAQTIDFNAQALGTQTFTQGIATYTNVNIFACATCTGAGDLMDDISRAARASGGGTYTIDFSSPIYYFGLYWGSPDPDNSLTFYNGVTPILSFTGANLISGFGVPGGLSGGAYVNFFASAGDTPATRIVVSGGQFPLESDNHAFSTAPSTVPEPTSLVLLATGLGLLARRRKRQQ